MAGGAPKSVRPESSRSGRAAAKCWSTRKYSCSGPQLASSGAMSVSPMRVSTRRAEASIAEIERSRGIFLSRDSPVHDMKTEGIIRVAPFAVHMMYAGLVGSQAV